MNPRIRAVSFDADGTLWDFEKVMRHSLAHALAELSRAVGALADDLTIERMIEIRNRAASDLKGRVTSLEEVRLEAFRRTLGEIGLQDEVLAVRLNETYLRHRFEDIELYEDVLPTLDALRGRYRLGMISNGNSYPERCGLAGRFDFVVFAQDHGFEKPDPRLFEVACRLAGCEPSQLLHVGDSPQDDVAGAKAAGAWAVWLNAEDRPFTGDVPPDFEILSLLELVSICEAVEHPSWRPDPGGRWSR